MVTPDLPQPALVLAAAIMPVVPRDPGLLPIAAGALADLRAKGGICSLGTRSDGIVQGLVGRLGASAGRTLAENDTAFAAARCPTEGNGADTRD